jgi:hypothetical protein
VGEHELSESKPELKQFNDLTPADFQRHPVWIACHTEDFAEPWFNETDEETFRPWIGALPVGPSDGMVLARLSGFREDDCKRYRGAAREDPTAKRGTMDWAQER